MFISKKISLIFGLILCLIGSFFYSKEQKKLPIIAIANLGPHASLDAIVRGIKKDLQSRGFVEGRNIQYDIADVNFNAALIPQMIAQLKTHHPVVMVPITTPVAQFAKGSVKDIPLVFSGITDPLAAGLIGSNITGSSDKQNLNLMLRFAKQLIPNLKNIGILYSTSESNDQALVQMLQVAAKRAHMTVVSVPIDQSRDIPVRMQSLRGQIDLLYVGGSGAIQPALPTIAAEAQKMRIPVINLDQAAAEENVVLASFGVDYEQVGKNTGDLVAEVLQGKKGATLPIYYPKKADHHAVISQLNAQALGIKIPSSLQTLVRRAPCCN